MADGAKTITARAYDAANNVATSGGSTFTVDNTAPSLKVITVLKALKPLRLRLGAVLTLTATNAAGQRKVGQWRVAKRTKVTYRCAAAGAKLRRC